MIHSLRHVALTVPKLEIGSDYYQTFGLNQTERAGGGALGFRCDGREHDEIVLIEGGERRKLHHISLGASAEGARQIESRLKSGNIAPLPKPASDAPEGLWFRDLTGTLINVQIAQRQPEVNGIEVAPINRPGSVARVARRAHASIYLDARPRRMGHIIVFTTDVAAQAEFYTKMLGMKVSDTIENRYGAFLRTPGDSDHHVIGFLKSDAPGFHHASFEMESIDYAEVAAKRLIGKGYRHAWGPGRHGVGSNYFHYFRDPWNGMAEYFNDIDWIPGDSEWQPKDWTKKDGMFMWSADGMPPPDFGKNYEI